MKKLLGLFVIIVFASLVSGIAFTQGGQPAPHASVVGAIPNVVGVWDAQGSEVCFADVTDTSGDPVFSSVNAPGAVVITDQTGTAFAGHQGNGYKVTGAVLQDGTISMQAWGPINRGFYSGKLSTQKNRRVMTITKNSYDEVALASAPNINMCTAAGTLTAQ